MNSPGRYLHWSIFQVSVANLALIAVMVVIFGAALILPFPHRRQREAEAAALAETAALADAHSGIDESDPSAMETGTSPVGAALIDQTAVRFDARDLGDDGDADMWTSKIRRGALAILPPGKLLPDRQPAYVASWIYVFGVASLAAFGVAIVSGFAIALGGPDWWHTNVVGHFFNSLHLWSVELFMAFIVIHLWGKFWMAAWRGRRTLTWMTGVVAFLASIIECFTGYLSQQNFDAQWISTNGKDAIDATGFGSFFNLLDFGQMLMWHIVLLPIILSAIIGAHVLLVRVRGVVHPLPAERTRGRAARRAAAKADAAAWRGPNRRYDIVKEASIATVLVVVLVFVLSAVLSSPDDPPVTIASWAKVAPADFIATAASEIAGTSETALYGPPYNHNSGSTQGLFGISIERAFGVRIPIDATQAFVIGPLEKLAGTDPTLDASLSVYRSASSRQQQRWANAYLTAVTKVHFVGGAPIVPAASDGPLPSLMTTELNLARSGALDADLLAQHPFYGTDFTKPLLFLEDGNYFSNIATADHLTGSQWGVMNETGSYPGQPWLWLYTLWYQVPGFSSSANVDVIAIVMTGITTLLLLCVPFIPGLRDIPRFIPLHRLVWKEAGASPED